MRTGAGIRPGLHLLFEDRFLERWRRVRIGILFPKTPDGNVAETEGVPVQIEHVRIKLQNAVSRNACRRRNESREARVDLRALRAVCAREKMPESKPVTSARLFQNDVELPRSSIGGRQGSIELDEGIFERR